MPAAVYRVILHMGFFEDHILYVKVLRDPSKRDGILISSSCC